MWIPVGGGRRRAAQSNHSSLLVCAYVYFRWKDYNIIMNHAVCFRLTTAQFPLVVWWLSAGGVSRIKNTIQILKPKQHAKTKNW